MYKEIIIVLIIIIIVVSLEFITQKYTSKIIQEMTNHLSEIEYEIYSVNKDNTDNKKLLNKINIVYDKWLKYHDVLSLYLEHNELEKVETDFVSFKSLIESSKYEFALSELEKAIFILNHIGDKYAFNLSNIF